MFEKNFNQINLNNELNTAVINSDLSKVKYLLSQEDIPFVDHEINGVALILYAAQHKDWEILEELYNQGAELNVKIPYMDWYLIHECIKSAPDRVTKAIIEYCDMNAKTKDGKTPLMVAIKENKIDMANYIVDLKLLDFSMSDKNGNNAAHIAAENGYYDLFLKLIENNTPINKENKDGKTPIDLISDVSFKENLPKIIGELSKQKIKNKIKPTIDESSSNTSSNSKEATEEVVKPKVSGLSSIKRKQ